MNVLEKQFLSEKLLRPSEFCERLNISVPNFKRMIARREVHYIKIGSAGVDALGRDRRAVRVPESEVYRLCECVSRIL